MQIFVTMKEKVVSLGKFSAVAVGSKETCPPFGLQQVLFLVHHVTTRKPTMIQRGIKTFNPTYLTEVTHISINDRKTDNDLKRNNNIQSYLLD